MTNKVTGTPPVRKLEDSFVELQPSDNNVEQQALKVLNAPQSPEKNIALAKLIARRSDKRDEVTQLRQQLFEQTTKAEGLERKDQVKDQIIRDKEQEKNDLLGLYQGLVGQAKTERENNAKKIKALEKKLSSRPEPKEPSSTSWKEHLSTVIPWSIFALTTAVGAGVFALACKVGNVAVAVLGGLTALIGTQAAAIKAIEDSEQSKFVTKEV